ncbi:MAG: ethanolamine utilization protein EutJ [Propionibacterium sp.]|nr:ethanolamine utilization protein EutJ [Propionibacterium sp.]
MEQRNALERFAQLVRTGAVDPGDGAVRLGVDLGTANIVLAVVDGTNAPVAGAWRHSSVVRDGVVVDWLGAVSSVSDLKSELEGRIGATFDRAAVTVPPGVDEGTRKVFTNVLEAAGLGVSEVVDEPVAAATALGLTDGAVIDIGHGTTGVSLLRDGAIGFSVDQATGGHHMTLVISGAKGIDYEEAEQFKTSTAQADLVFGLVRPTLEKMATIAADALRGHDVREIHLVGGASTLPRAAEVFEGVLGEPVRRPAHPLFPTPYGTAMRRTP